MLFLDFYPVISGFLLFLVVFSLWKHRKLKTQHVGVKPYMSCQRLLSKSELVFFTKLQKAISSSLFVSCQVRMVDVVKPDPRQNKTNFLKARARVMQKHFDFVLCRAHDGEIVCIIELDDFSHDNPLREESDQFKNQACRHAQIPLLRYRDPHFVSIARIQKDVQKSLSYKKKPHINPCPKCGGLLLTRENAQKKQVTYCSSYPRCRYKKTGVTRV